MKTYPCVIGSRIVELTAAERDAFEKRSMPVEERIARLEEQIKRLSDLIGRLDEHEGAEAWSEDLRADLNAHYAALK